MFTAAGRQVDVTRIAWAAPTKTHESVFEQATGSAFRIPVGRLVALDTSGKAGYTSTLHFGTGMARCCCLVYSAR